MGIKEKKEKQLGMKLGTAEHRLRKKIMFCMAEKLGMTVCYRCNKKIESIDEVSIEHKNPWLDSENPIEKFFDIENIAFSHLSCNSSVGRRNRKYTKLEFLEKERKRKKNYMRDKYSTESRRKKYRETGY